MKSFKKNTRGQIKFGETVGILIVVYFIIMIGLFWYNSINEDDLKELRIKKEISSSLEKQTFLTHTPFLKTSRVRDKEQYVDIITLNAFYNFSKTKEGQDYLKSKLGNAKVEIEVFSKENINNLYHESKNITELRENDDVITYLLYNVSNIDEKDIISTPKLTSAFPVEDLDGNKEMGILRITIFSKVQI